MNKNKAKFKALRKLFLLSLVFGIFFMPIFSAAAVDEVVTTAITNVRIFDGKKVIPSGTVVISEDKIVQVGKDVQIPEGSQIIEGKGFTLLPGFFDSHVHIWTSQNLKQSLVFGVTTVVDMFMDIKTMAEIKKKQLSNQSKDMAFLISSGTLTTAPGGHGTQYGTPIPTISTPEEAQAFVNARIAEGSDFIKIILDDGSAYGTNRPTLDKATLSAVIHAAHQKKKLTIIHAATLKNCMEAMEAGVDGLAHLYFNNANDPDFGSLAARKKVFVIPTLTVLESMQGGIKLIEDQNLLPYLTPNDITMLKATFPFQIEKEAFAAAQKALKQLKDEHVPILAGTDAPNPGTTYGASLHYELELLVKSGLSPTEALQSATSIPAKIFGLKDRGHIKAGFKADLLLVKGDPTKDILNSRNIIQVWRKGLAVDRNKYLASIEKAKKDIENQKKAPPPENSESGWISDFEGKKISSNFGAGWSISTDSMMGGKSYAEYRWENEGSLGSRGSLLITGMVDKESSTPWAGAFFSPGPYMMSPANLSFKKSISFWAKGDEKTFSVMIFAQSLGFIPAMKTFTTGMKWKEYVFPFKDFNIEGHDIMGIFIGSSTEAGKFLLQIDNVRLK